MTDLIKSVLDDFWSGKILGSFPRSPECQKGQILWFYVIFANNFKKSCCLRNCLVFGPFWGAGGPYPGGENIPLPILHHFPPSKPQNGLKMILGWLNTGFVSGFCWKKMSQSPTKLTFQAVGSNHCAPSHVVADVFYIVVIIQSWP